MKIFTLFLRMGIVGLVSLSCAQTENLDREINQLADKLTAQVKESGRKMVTVLEFTDLQGNPSELGRFVAEEVSVSLVERRSGFTVIDRANLKTLLAQQKLTEDGLVDPNNAREFKKASGVDAIILGKLTVFKDSVALAAKILATDSAETLGAARARLPMSMEIEQLLLSASAVPMPATEKQGPGAGQLAGELAANRAGQVKREADIAAELEVQKNSASVGEFFVKVESLRETRNSLNGQEYVTATVAILNQGDVPKLVRIPYLKNCYSSITNKFGTTFTCYDKDFVSGVLAGDGTYTVIGPKRAIIVTLSHTKPRESGNADARPCRLAFHLFSALQDASGSIKGEQPNYILVEIQ